MREAYLTGGNEHYDATDAPATDVAEAEQPSAPIYWFEQVTLTEDGHLKLVGTRHAGDASDDFTLTRNRIPHADLLRTLRQLTLHMCLLTERTSPPQLYPQPAPAAEAEQPRTDLAARLALRDALATGEAYVHPDLLPYKCLAVQWKSKGVILKGEKQARYRFSKALPVATPEIVLLYGLDAEEVEENEYPYYGELEQALTDLRAELLAYVLGKYGDHEQLELFGREPEPAASPVSDFVNYLEELAGQGMSVEISGSGGNPVRLSGKDAASGSD